MSAYHRTRSFANIALSVLADASVRSSLRGVPVMVGDCSMEVSLSNLPKRGAVSSSTLTNILAGALLVAALYFGRQVLVPIALAILLSFVLSPAVRLLQGKYFPRVAAVAVVGLLAFTAIFGLGTILAAEVHDLAKNLPRYQSTLQAKIESVRGAAVGAGTVERAVRVLQSLKKEIEAPTDSSPSLADGATASKPVPVEIRQPNPGALQTLTRLITPLIQPLTTTGIVVIFVIFILLQQKDLRNRLVRLAGAHDLQRTTAALDDAGERLSRLLLAQLVLNAIFGLVIGAGLAIIGVPSAPLWGMLAMILRFVPYFGAVIAAAFPLVLAVSVGPGWGMVLLAAALFLVVEPILGQVIEPMVYGQHAGLSPVAVIVSVSFWTWLWGPIGLILATPLTICLVVVGRHVERLNFLEVMFGDQPPLTPPELIYQRMLARDPVEIADQASSFLKEKSVGAYFEDILLPGLRLATADADKGQLDIDRIERIRDAVTEIIEDVATHEDQLEAVRLDGTENAQEFPLSQLQNVEATLEGGLLPSRWRTGKPVLCIPGRGLLDEAACMMIVHLLERRQIGARAEPAGALTISRLSNFDLAGVELVCICYLENVSAAQVRYAVRRFRRRAPDVGTIVALLGPAAEIDGRELSPHVELIQGHDASYPRQDRFNCFQPARSSSFGTPGRCSAERLTSATFGFPRVQESGRSNLKPRFFPSIQPRPNR
jgi:predicted PurR-regulated permease PerM